MTTLCINPRCPQPENSDDRDRCQKCGSRLRVGQRFRPVRLLGQGGFGRTFLALDEAATPPTPCVIKQILRSRGSRRQDLEEADRLAKLGQHPQIPTLIAILESERDLCLVQTYVPGRDLEQQLQVEGPWGESQGRSLLMSLLPVLQFIHNQGIIHRDIKPENIILPGPEQPPMLVDFGAARTAPSATELEQTGTIIGSPGYAAPEQALGKAVPASDLYSLGLTVLHLLTGVHPFDLYSVTEDRWIWREILTQPVGDGLARILDRLVARSLRSRYASAEAVLADLAPAGMTPVQVAPDLLPLPQGAQWRCTQVWQTPERTANSLAVSPDGRAIATGNSDNTVQLWDNQTGEVIHTFARRFGLGEGHRDAVTGVVFHPAGETLFSASQDSTVKQWGLGTYRLQRTLHQPGWQISAIALTPNGSGLATGDVEGRIALWDAGRGQQTADLVRHEGKVNGLALSPDGLRLASVDEAGSLRLWTLPAGQLLHTWDTRIALRAVALSVAPPALITGDRQGKLIAWSLMDFSQATDLGSHQDAVSAIALSPDGRWLATGGRDCNIYLWRRTETGWQRWDNLHHDWGIAHLTFTPTSQTLVSSGADETIRFWQLVQ